MDEITLKYEFKIPNDGSHDQAISLNFSIPGTLIQHLSINPEDKSFFQRIRIYDNGLVISEEVWNDYRIFRFSHPYTQDGDILTINV